MSDKIPMPKLDLVDEFVKSLPEDKCSRCGGVKVIGDESCQNHVNKKVKFICDVDGCNNHVTESGAACEPCQIYFNAGVHKTLTKETLEKTVGQLGDLGATLFDLDAVEHSGIKSPWFKDYLLLLDRAVGIIAERGKDYNQGSVDMPDYFPFGDKSYFQMLWVKILRLQSLVESEGSVDAKMDSIIDLINYAAFYGVYLIDLP